jgi:4a-hydroxytetrahydrobiopterin dehydratase
MPAFSPAESEQHLARLDGWKLTHDGKRIRKDWKVSNFIAGLEFFGQVATVAEEMQHHPDLHLENYKEAWIEIWTHSEGGLTASDFELASRIDDMARYVES